MFYLKAKDLEERTRLLDHLKNEGVLVVFHYVPLHTAPAGRSYARFHGVDTYTTSESERLLRLPLWYGINKSELEHVVESVFRFYNL